MHASSGALDCYTHDELAAFALRWLAESIDTYLAHLVAEGIPDPLGQPLTLACVLADLCDFAYLEPPPAIAEHLGHTA
jgi:hypothetical protein